jgi:two-component system phosphate regulon response regulator PhoB
MSRSVLSFVESNHALTIGPDRQSVRVDGQLVELLATQFRVLELLAGSPGRIFSRTEILDGIYSQRYAVTPRAVDGHIADLRRRLGPVSSLIETVRGAGYRFKAVAGSPSPSFQGGVR